MRPVSASAVMVCTLLLVLPASPATAQPVDPRANGRIAFVADGQAIATIDADGTGYARITTGAYPDWAPGGDRIAFTRFGPNAVENVGLDVLVMEADGTDEVNLTESNPRNDFDPAFSPDGETIAFTSGRGTVGVHLMNADGSDVRLLVANASHPTWSPDGDRIAFQIASGASSEIGVIDVDGTGFRQLTSGPGVDGSPAWSPDGTRIAWQSDGATSVIATMAPDGSDRRDVATPPVGGDVRDPAWSPDSSTILFSTYRGGAAGPPLNYRLWAVDRDGGNEREIYAGAGVSAPDWGPVPRQVETIVVTPGDPTVRATGRVRFCATATYGDGTTADVTGDVTWSSSDPRVATISPDGRARALAAGSTTVTATLGEHPVASTVLTVRQARDRSPR